MCFSFAVKNDVGSINRFPAGDAHPGILTLKLRDHGALRTAPVRSFCQFHFTSGRNRILYAFFQEFLSIGIVLISLGKPTPLPFESGVCRGNSPF